MARLRIDVGMDLHYVNVFQMFTKQKTKHLNVINIIVIIMTVD